MSNHIPSRRDFLHTLGTGLAASVVGPTILGASDKAGSKPPVIGSGEFTYEVYHDWGELPAGIKYGNTHGVCEDSQGQIYIHHTVHASSERHDTMVVFDKHGKFVRSWGAEFEGGAHGLANAEAEYKDFILFYPAMEEAAGRQAAVQRGGDRADGQEHGEAGRQRVGRRRGTRTQAVTHLDPYFSPANAHHPPS
jgi:hypothetical protein